MAARRKKNLCSGRAVLVLVVGWGRVSWAAGLDRRAPSSWHKVAWSKSFPNIGRRGPTTSGTNYFEGRAARRDALAPPPVVGGVPVSHDAIAMRLNGQGRILPIPQRARYRSREWLENLRTLPSSQMLRHIRSPVVGVTGFSALIVVLTRCVSWFDQMSTVPHALLGSTLGLLLTFRTNAAYNRFWEGRTLWQGVVDRARELARLSSAYAPALGDERYRRICNLIAIFPLMLEYHLEGRRSASRFLRERERDANAVDRRRRLQARQKLIEEAAKRVATGDVPTTVPEEEEPVLVEDDGCSTRRLSKLGEDLFPGETPEEITNFSPGSGGFLDSSPRLAGWSSSSSTTTMTTGPKTQNIFETISLLFSRGTSSSSNNLGETAKRHYASVNKGAYEVEVNGTLEYSAREFDQFMPTRGLVESANRPLFVANALATEVANVPDSADGFFTNRERGAVLDKINAMALAIGGCERIVQTPVPLSYARHTSRFLSLWCLTLPLCLAPKLKWLTPPTMAFIAWGLFGIQEIGLWIEDPFRGALDLSIQADTIFCDVSETAAIFNRARTEKAPPPPSNFVAAAGPEDVSGLSERKIALLVETAAAKAAAASAAPT